MKILAIGNSFSQDATRYLQDIAASAGEKLYVRNLYIGGCSLERHSLNIKSGAEDYCYEEDCRCLRKISIGEALETEKWDHVTVQQCSGKSGIQASYEPFLTELIDFIKSKSPDAKIAFHRTWAYETDSMHGEFLNYRCDQNEMYRAIVAASGAEAERHGLPIIGVGDAIQRARALPEFDHANGGLSLCRDGFHLSLDYGRFLAGLVWFCFFTGRAATDVIFRPENTDEKLIKKLISVV